ncbi:MAG: hypothetical protein RL328_1123 [Acidobacteriota bacterium]|jgi:hypothetical protein
MKLLLVCLLPVFAAAQSVAWDDSPHAAAIAEQAARLKPLISQLRPDDWIAKGAPQAYLSQLDRAKQDLDALANAAALADRQPNKLTTALDTYFRLQTIEWEFESILEAVRKYQNPAVADLMVSVLRGNSANRDALREFITDLAARKEQEFTVISQDAQACRTQLSKIPTAAPRRSTK